MLLPEYSTPLEPQAWLYAYRGSPGVLGSGGLISLCEVVGDELRIWVKVWKIQVWVKLCAHAEVEGHHGNSQAVAHNQELSWVQQLCSDAQLGTSCSRKGARREGARPEEEPGETRSPPHGRRIMLGSSGRQCGVRNKLLGRNATCMQPRGQDSVVLSNNM